MSKFSITACLIFLFQVSAAQLKISGIITDPAHKPLSYSSVSLLSGSNEVVATAVADSSGNYQLSNIKAGAYAISFRFIAYRDTIIRVTLNADTLIAIQLRSSQMLSEVMVKAKKPVFLRETDRFRFNVAGTGITIGNNVWDVLGKTPLVNVSEDGQIQISGTSGAIVYINNKKKILSGTALRSYLSGLPADNLESIEVITTPPSRYEAEGGAGIINIITTKSKDEGLIGNISLSTRQSAVNSEAGSIYLNERQGKWNIYSTLYFGNRSRKPLTDRNILFPVTNISSVIQRHISSHNQYQELYPGISTGIDYQLDKRSVLGMLFEYSGNWRKEMRNAITRDKYADADSLSSTRNTDKINSQTYSLNLNYQGQLDTAGKTLSVDYDAIIYRSGYYSNNVTTPLDAVTAEPLSSDYLFRTSSPQDINNQSIKADFDWPINKKAYLSIGGKASFSMINNNFLFENQFANNSWVANESQSNRFEYHENINGLYGNFSYRINPEWAYQLGARIENTRADGWLDEKKVVDRNYTNIFPAAFLKLTTKKNGTYVFAVTGRITRPGYWDLNPFRAYTTDQAYFAGNPFLTSVKYYRQELSHSISGKAGSLTLQLAASQTLGEIYSLPYSNGDTIINKKTNYGNRYGYSVTANYNNQLTAWWRFSGTVVTGYVLTRGAYANDINIRNNTAQLILSANQTFTISKKAGISGTMIVTNSFPGTIVNTRIGNRLDTDIRLRKAAGAFNITLSAQDLFKSNKDRFSYTLGDLRIKDNYYNDTRSVALAVAYSFGKKTVKSNRDRDTGSDDVKDRLK
jgi:hypothetical protein